MSFERSFSTNHHGISDILIGNQLISLVNELFSIDFSHVIQPIKRKCHIEFRLKLLQGKLLEGSDYESHKSRVTISVTKFHCHKSSGQAKFGISFVATVHTHQSGFH